MKQDSLFEPELTPDEYGDVSGLTWSDLVRAVQVWALAQEDQTLTVGDAAKAFNVTPGFLAMCIDREDNPFFFASQHDLVGVAPASRILEHDGL